MTSLRRALIALAVIAFLVGTAMLALILSSDNTHAGGAFASPGVYAAYTLVIGWGFIGTGLYAWDRRPQNNVGALMAAVGAAWLLQGLATSGSSIAFSAGTLIRPVTYAFLVHLLLAFPTGRFETSRQRWLATFVYVNVTVLQLAGFVFNDTTASYADCDGCPANPLLLTSSEFVSNLVSNLEALFAAIAVVGLVVVLRRRWQGTAAGQRQALTPVIVAGGLALFFLALSMIANAFGARSAAIGGLLIAFTVLAAVPFAFLAGLLRSRFGRAEAVTALVSRLGEGARRTALREALADALGDPALKLAYWVPETSSYVELGGSPAMLPEAGSGRCATEVEHDGRRVGAIIHDASLANERNLMRTIAAAVALTLENERLEAELRAKVAELQASRSRIVEAGYEQRRQLERDLHDGAQQRLMALGINLRLARDRIGSDSEGAAELVDFSLEELNAATSELRELARGIHPAVLTDRGLAAALEGLAGRSPVSVEVTDAPDDRLPASVESAVYFVVAEALTNVARYASAKIATVSVVRSDGRVEVKVSDDGVGGADPERGSGLRGLADRVAALNGRLELTSADGEGTTVRASIPCA